MPESLLEFLAEDHERLDRLLDRATATPDAIDRKSYDAFRAGLLRHIAMEERTLFPAIARNQEGKQVSIVKKLRLDHGALSALLVPPPDSAIIATIRFILRLHNALEEKEDGIYRLLDRLAGTGTEEMLATLKATPDVPVAPYNERPGVLEATRRAVSRAGYEFPPPAP